LVTYESVRELLWFDTWDDLGGRLAVRLDRGPLLLVRLCGLAGGEILDSSERR
jgi:hypothetical protein